MDVITNLPMGRSSAEGAKCDGARILNSRAERSKEHRAFHADRQDDLVAGGDWGRCTAVGDAAGSTSRDCGASGLEFEGEVTSGDGRDLKSAVTVERCESGVVTDCGDPTPSLTDILRHKDSSLAARWSANSLSNGRLRPTTALLRDSEWIYNHQTMPLSIGLLHLRAPTCPIALGTLDQSWMVPLPIPPMTHTGLSINEPLQWVYHINQWAAADPGSTISNMDSAHTNTKVLHTQVLSSYQADLHKNGIQWTHSRWQKYQSDDGLGK